MTKDSPRTRTLACCALFILSAFALTVFTYLSEGVFVHEIIDELRLLLTKGQSGTLAMFTLMSLGLAAGLLLARPVAKWIGSLPALFCALFLFAVSHLGAMMAGDSYAFVAFRFLGGFALGVAISNALACLGKHESGSPD